MSNIVNEALLDRFVKTHSMLHYTEKYDVHAIVGGEKLYEM